MKRLTFLLAFAFGFILTASAQGDFLKEAKMMKPPKDFDNIHVEKLHSDKHCSSFVIWVKDKVKPHFHARHSEHVYVLKGKGTMRVGKQMFEIKKGDVIFIPEGTPHGVKVTGGTLKVLSVQAPEFKGKDRVFVDQ